MSDTLVMGESLVFFVVQRVKVAEKFGGVAKK